MGLTTVNSDGSLADVALGVRREDCGATFFLACRSDTISDGEIECDLAACTDYQWAASRGRYMVARPLRISAGSRYAFSMTNNSELKRLLALGALALAACGGETDPSGSDATPTEDVDTAEDVVDVEPDADVAEPDSDAIGPDLPEDTEGDADVEDSADVEPDVVEPLPELVTQAPFATPNDPLEGTEVESCAVYQEERCNGGEVQRCAVYDTGGEEFVTELDPLLRRAFIFDRVRDLYNSPDGQAIDRDFIGDMMPGTPEDEWASMERFKCYCGTGDGGIWTGWSTVASVLRYTQTGTEADYRRMEQHVRDLLTMYDVTGVPGYLSRYHYLLMPEGGPITDAHIQRWEDTHSDSHHRRLVADPESIENLPTAYTEGITDEFGEVWMGTPMWQGRPSIDQNTGPMTALPMAHGLLRDEELKGRIEHHLTCYLKRLQRIELINLQSNPDLLETLLAYFSSGDLQLEEDDIDLTAIDTVVGYIHLQINTLNEDTYDRSCPDSVQLEPFRVIDATSDTFIFDLLDLISDMNTSEEHAETFDHYYFPSIRGGDAMHMMHLATMAYHFTGDEQYREFLYNELIGNVQTLGVTDAAGAFQLPKYCRSYFGDQITYGPWWAFLHLLGESPLRTSLQQAFHDEIWSKHLNETGNADLAIMYAGAVPPEIATDRDAALALAGEILPMMGGNGGALMGNPFDPLYFDDPKRVYTLTADQVLSNAREGTMAVCPDPQEIAACTADIQYAGVSLPGLASGTHTCNDSPSECPVGDEDQCMTWRTNIALPPPLRPATDFLWQRDAFAIGVSPGQEGWRQFAGTDYSEPYWNARRYGFIEEGAGQVLAWETVGACEE